ncbi:MAG TPA: 2OG-Fe(II) oxygenase family protein [Stellaceae bacterium]|nr:2OG-Fe(II) oxygenase family protein [Stellaceae bacterium]
MQTIKDDEVKLFADFDNRQRVQSIGQKHAPGKTIPTIDFGAYINGGSLDERKSVARALHDTCIDTGFFYLANHGISESEITLAHDWGRLFFALPRAVKSACNFTPVGGKNPSANPDKETDQKETYSLPRPLLPGEPDNQPGRTIGRGKWIDPALMPGFREFLEAHLVKRIRVAQQLCRALALSLDLPEDYLDAAHRFPSGSLTYNYYPPVDPATAGHTQWGISPHTDYGSFSLLSQDELGGLEVRDSSGVWIDLPPIPGAFVVNIADLMARWTNGYYVSSLHRASNFNTGTKARISLPLFFNPHAATIIECLPSCQGPGNPPKYEPVAAGPYVQTLIEQSNRIGRPGVMQKTAEERLGAPLA